MRNLKNNNVRDQELSTNLEIKDNIKIILHIKIIYDFIMI